MTGARTVALWSVLIGSLWAGCVRVGGAVPAPIGSRCPACVSGFRLVTVSLDGGPDRSRCWVLDGGEEEALDPLPRECWGDAGLFRLPPEAIAPDLR